MNLNRPISSAKKTSEPSERRAVGLRGKDVNIVVGFSLAEAINGIERELTYSAVQNCAPCSGSGRLSQPSILPCEKCSGSGRHTNTIWTPEGRKTRHTFLCTTCSGEGMQPRALCASCKGKGEMKGTRRVKVAFPPGASNQLRVKGMGDEGKFGAPSGDLILQIVVHVDPGMGKIEGLDLVKELPVTIFDVLVGGEVTVDTPRGPRILLIPPGTDSGSTLRVRGGGVTSAHAEKGGGRHGEVGDARFVLKVVIPRPSCEAEIEILHKLRHLATGAR